MDNLVFEESVNAEVEQSEFISKKWIYVNDSNSQNYTSQIVIDSTPLANAGGYINWQEGFIVMPLVVSLTSANTASLPADTTDDSADHTWAFKAGFWHMINSMTVEFNNQNIVQQTPFLNVFRSFKAHTSFSQDDLISEGSTIGYWPDTAGSWTYSASTPQASSTAGTPNGSGLCNNQQTPVLVASNPIAGTSVSAGAPYFVQTAFAGSAGTGVSTGASNPSLLAGSQYAHNEGFAKRSDWYGYDPLVTGTMGQDLINDSSTDDLVYRSSVLAKTLGVRAWQVYAKLRLKDLNDFFQKAPLLKGSTIRFYINTNQASCTFVKNAPVIASAGITTQPSMVLKSSSVLGGLTQPLMVASSQYGQGCSSLPADTYTLSVSIVKNTALGLNAKLQSCRLYAPVYKMNPIAEQRYLSLAPTKKVNYRDIFQYQFSNLDPNSPFNILVTNGIANIKSVLVVPFISSKTNPYYPSATDVDTTAHLGTASTISTLLSPFATSGATPDAITLSNFNILVSGVNLFLNNENYDFEQFNNELKSSNQLNGSLTTGLASGLISEDMFSRGYRYYYGNCSRILPSEEGVSRSIQIQGQNLSKVSCDLMVFVEFEKSIVIDISTGARIE